MIFIIVAIVGMLIARKIGWSISKLLLYPLTMIFSAILCFIWGIIIAFLIAELISWQNPYIIIKIIFGYGLGAYVAVPNYGLISETTISRSELSKHYMIKLLPLSSYIIFSIVFAFLIK